MGMLALLLGLWLLQIRDIAGKCRGRSGRASKSRLYDDRQESHGVPSIPHHHSPLFEFKSLLQPHNSTKIPSSDSKYPKPCVFLLLLLSSPSLPPASAVSSFPAMITAMATTTTTWMIRSTSSKTQLNASKGQSVRIKLPPGNSLPFKSPMASTVAACVVRSRPSISHNRTQ
jgi:hypothetical protein